MNKPLDPKGLGVRLRGLMGGQNQEQFARQLDINRPQLARYLTGRMPDPSILIKIADRCQVTIDYLVMGRDLRLPLIAEALPTYRKTKPRMVPVLTWVQAGALASAIDPYPYQGAADEYVGVTVHGEHCVALRVQGHSMTPEFRPGDVIVIDPDQREGQSGDYVVVKDDASEQGTLKQFVRTVEGPRLRPLNPQHGELIFSPEHRIVGKVVRLIRSY